MKLVGIDGCKAGWVMASAGPNLAFHIRPNLHPIARQAKNGSLLAAIDMPIGLAAAGPRQCDLDAKALLGRRGSSVFITPCRAALRAVEDYERACELNRKACGKAFSKQAFGILRKIREIDRFMTPALQDHLREAHPEVIFAVHNAAPMQHRKSTAEGKAERL